MILSNCTLLGKRKSGGAWGKGADAGRWLGETEADISAEGSLQPVVSGRVMDSLPEGRRSRMSYVFISEADLKTVADPADLTPQNADIFMIQGEAFEVVKAAPWTDPLLGHSEYILQKSHPIEP